MERQADGSLLVTTEAGERVECDVVMYATGRRPYTEGLGLEAAGVQTNPKTGAIQVDGYSRTNVDSIFAVGCGPDSQPLLFPINTSLYRTLGPAPKEHRRGNNTLPGIHFSGPNRLVSLTFGWF